MPSELEVTELMERLSAVARHGLPLADGLRAAASETSPAWRESLERLATALDRGSTLEQVQALQAVPLPPYLVGALDAGVRSGRLSTTLLNLVELQRTLRAPWRSLGLVLSYPLVVLGLTLLVVVPFVGCFVMPEVVSHFEPSERKTHSFFFIEPPELILPGTMRSLSWLMSGGISSLLVIAALSLVSLVLVRVSAGRALWTRIVSSEPWIGILIHWQGLLEWSYLLRLLLQNQLPLPEALHLTSGALRNADLAQATRVLAHRVEEGESLAQALRHDLRFPETLASFVESNHGPNSLMEGLRIHAQWLEVKIQLRCRLLELVLPPTLFVIVGAVVITLFAALLLPMMNYLRQNLMY